MSKQYDNTNRGALWIQTEKKTETSPDIKGKINIDGTDYEFIGWKKFTASGEMFSLVRSVPKKKEDAPKPVPQGGGSNFDDDIPFSYRKDLI